MTLYLVKEVDGEIPESAELNPLRYSDCSVVGSIEKIDSDVVLPETRFKATAETGTESNSGDISTEWNIDEQDEMFAGVMCSEWEDVEDDDYEVHKELKLGVKRNTYSLLKHYPQNPEEWQLFKNEQFNQLTIDFLLNSFVKLTWGVMGANHPKTVTSDPCADCTYLPALTTKSFKTLEGYIKMGDSWDNLKAIRQLPSFSLTINNNLESTQALFEKESIEQSLGDFEVTGNCDVWKADTIATQLSNDAIDGATKCIEIAVTRSYGGKDYTYIIKIEGHLDDSTESKDGNKLKNTINFSVGSAEGLKFIKLVK